MALWLSGKIETLILGVNVIAIVALMYLFRAKPSDHDLR
jgi:hypothetical protein